MMPDHEGHTTPHSERAAPSPSAARGSDADALFASLYNELQALAQVIFRDQSPAHTLQPTALVHEAYLKIASAASPPAINDREHALALGAKAMRQLLINHANAANALKRGGGKRKRLTLTGIASDPDRDTLEILALEEALRELESLDERQCRVIECRYLGGLTVDETARVLGVSPRTVELDARVARLWLLSRLEELGHDDA
jgi:RNA polymerase sigma factor (TIGR02999 family)